MLQPGSQTKSGGIHLPRPPAVAFLGSSQSRRQSSSHHLSNFCPSPPATKKVLFPPNSHQPGTQACWKLRGHMPIAKAIAMPGNEAWPLSRLTSRERRRGRSSKKSQGSEAREVGGRSAALPSPGAHLSLPSNRSLRSGLTLP